MKRLIYQVYVGPRCRLYDHCTASVAAYCKLHGIEHIIQTEPILRIRPNPETSNRSEGAMRLGYLPIFEKENALAYLSTHDQVAVIDADVYVRTGSPNVFDAVHKDADFSAVIERDMPLTETYAKKVRGYSAAQYGDLGGFNWDKDGADFRNMGVMVMGREMNKCLRGETPREFLARPQFERFINGIGNWKWSTDQTLLNWWLTTVPMLIEGLHWRWNCLYGAVRPEALAEAYFVHFFLMDYLPNKGENIEELMEAIQ